MKAIRRANERGRTRWDWLDSRHTFSFGEYLDPEHMGFRSLRVINDDTVQPGQGFGTHPHRDMEILTYVLSGKLAHRDSMDHGRTIEAGELQAMSAGRGITHSEFNASDAEPVHFLQMWIIPAERGLVPSYAEWKPTERTGGGLTLLASASGKAGSVHIHQDAELWLARLAAGEAGAHRLRPDRHVWVHVAAGKVSLDGQQLSAGDGVAVSDESEIKLVAESSSQVLLFDLG